MNYAKNYNFTRKFVSLGNFHISRCLNNRAVSLVPSFVLLGQLKHLLDPFSLRVLSLRKVE